MVVNALFFGCCNSCSWILIITLVSNSVILQILHNKSKTLKVFKLFLVTWASVDDMNNLEIHNIQILTPLQCNFCTISQ